MKRTRLGIFAIAALIALVSTACSTVPPSRNERRVEGLVAELNTADEERLLRLCALPFLLDGETVAREEDLRTLWRNLRATGFAFSDADIEEIREAGDGSYRAFADDPEAAAFFKKRLGKDAAVVTLKTGRGTFLLLTDGRVGKRGRLPKLYGFTTAGGK